MTVFDFSTQVTPSGTMLVVLFGMLVLAALDVWRQEVEDYATAALLVVAIFGLAIEGISPTQWLTAIVSSAVAFGVYLILGMRGSMGGGDVKLSIVPSLVLGAANPFLGIWWVCLAILIHQLLILGIHRPIRRHADGTAGVVLALPHVPAMAAAMFAAICWFPGIM